jgi:hypothetical protein
MQRWTFALFGLMFAAAIVVVVLQARAPAPVAAAEPPRDAQAAPPDAEADDAPGEDDTGDGNSPSPANGPDFAALPDGGAVPELPKSAPRRVGFGAILFAYAGAEYAPKDARSKQEAREKARATIEAAQRDFAEAVKLGDPGSTVNAGQVPRDILEPAVEYVLFTMDKDQVHPEPIDTPRGFWIVKRTK